MNILKLLFTILLITSCTGQDTKINGLSFVAAPNKINQSHVNPVVNVNANYAAIMPFGFIKNLEHPDIIYNTDRQWFGETTEGAKQYIEELRKRNIKIMLKPQLWVWRGEFTGFIKMQNETDWKIFENSYSAFILEHAHLAQDTKTEIFCIGTELEAFIKNRPKYWQKVIEQIRHIYKGKLTYAANWDEFKRIPFWKQLDYIGIDAYFPVSDRKTPTVEECREGWQTHKQTILKVSKTHDKPILFTEFGYRSLDFAGKEPWVSDHTLNTVNLEAQYNNTQALLEEFWSENWFAGGFVWKWFHAHDKVGGKNDAMFTPQNKPTETLIKNHYYKKEYE